MSKIDLFDARSKQKLYSEKNVSVFRLTNKDLIKLFEENRIKNPFNQISLDENKIEEFQKTWEKNNDHTLLTIISFVEISNDDDDYEYFLADGQHRINAIKEFYKKNKNTLVFICNLIKCTTEKECNQIFSDLNADSRKNINFINSDILTKLKTNDLREFLRKNYEKCFRQKKNKNSNIMTLEEFIDDIVIYMDKIKHVDLTKIQKKLKSFHEKYLDRLNYKEELNDNKLFYSDETNILKDTYNCMFLKQNNFRKAFAHYLSKDNINYEHDYKFNREGITQQMRKKVWTNEYKTRRKGICPVKYCQQSISSDNFIVGHITSVKNGGLTEVENLRPICYYCNMKMSKTNWQDYEKTLVEKEISCSDSDSSEEKE